MLHAREDYSRIQDPAGHIPADEPVFLLRGQDPAAPVAIEAWAEEAELYGADAYMVRKALDHADKMREWQKTHKKKEAPDMPLEGQAATGGGIQDLNDINTSTPEGRLLMAALAKITAESQRDKTPFEVIDQLNELKAKMYDEGGNAQRVWDDLVAESAEKQRQEEMDAKAEAEDRDRGE